MKKSIIKSILFLTIASLLGACGESFLEEEPKGFLGESNLQNEEGINAALVGAYALLDGMNIDGANTWSANPQNWIFGSVPSDDAYKGSEQTDFAEMTQLEIYQWSAGNSIMNDKWVSSYEGVVRANSTIRLLGGADLPDAVRDNLEGQARFLRAYYHFELYKVWGNVPYFTEADEDFVKSNEGVDPLGDAIADMTAAVNLLPATQDDAGRATKDAARAMLGKFYMYKYGESGSAADASSTKDNLDPVVASRALTPCFKDMFHTSTENNPAMIFSVQSSINDGGNSRNANWLNQLAFPAGSSFGCCGFHQPSQDLVNAYKVDANGLPMFDNYNDSELDPSTDAVDPRIDLTIGRDNVPYWDWDIHDASWIRDRAFSGPYSPKKFTHYKADPVSTGGWNNNAYNGINFSIIRLADAMLLLAEAEVILGNLSAAEDLVNAIRERAGNCAQGPFVDGGGAAVITDDINDPGIEWANYDVQPYPAGTFASNGSEFAMNAVRWERRLELALEGHRFFDLRRWGIAAEVLNKYTEYAAKTRSYYADAATYEARHRWYPIPTIQINANTRNGEQILKQNTGW